MSKPVAERFGKRILLEKTQESASLVKESHFGTEHPDGSVELSDVELLHLLASDHVVFKGSRGKKLHYKDALRVLSRNNPRLWEQSRVYSVLRSRGYVVKTALKFGADFRVYQKGVAPGEDHSLWLVYAVREKERYTWQEFSAKNRVAHSTKKKLVLGVVDDEGDVSFWECRWIRP